MRKRLNAFLLLCIVSPVLPLFGAAWLLRRVGEAAEWLAEVAAPPFAAVHNWLARRLGEDEIG